MLEFSRKCLSLDNFLSLAKICEKKPDLNIIHHFRPLPHHWEKATILKEPVHARLVHLFMIHHRDTYRLEIINKNASKWKSRGTTYFKANAFSNMLLLKLYKAIKITCCVFHELNRNKFPGKRAFMTPDDRQLTPSYVYTYYWTSNLWLFE